MIVYTRDKVVMRKLDALVTGNLDVFKRIGKTDIDKTYEMPKNVVTYRKPRRLSDEQRKSHRNAGRILIEWLEILPSKEYNGVY